jgi:uncharacterized protein (DUF1697 family)
VPVHAVLLRGINLGPNNRIAMPALREALAATGFDDVRTYLQSGNVVLRSDASAGEVARGCGELIARHFALDIPVVVRTAAELAEVVDRSPIPQAHQDPKRYTVTFLSAEPPDESVERLRGLALDGEHFVAAGREFYSWHPAGIARSKLAAGLASPRLGVVATARNWTTVTTLLQMVQADAG